MLNIPALDANGCPVDRIVDDLPAGMTEIDRPAFAFRVMDEQGHRLRDYLAAAIHQALAKAAAEGKRRWIDGWRWPI